MVNLVLGPRSPRTVQALQGDSRRMSARRVVVVGFVGAVETWGCLCFGPCQTSLEPLGNWGESEEGLCTRRKRPGNSNVLVRLSLTGKED